MNDATLPRDYFDRLYAENSDPWRFRTSDYEREKYADTIDALDGAHFEQGVEVGCSIGELTARLAPWCGTLLGIDTAAAPLRLARTRNAAWPHVDFAQQTLPRDPPLGEFDLIVLSEVLYYFSADDLGQLAAWTSEVLRPGGVALLVHWLGETPDYPRSGDEAVEAFLRAVPDRLTTDLRRRRALYRIDRLRCLA